MPIPLSSFLLQRNNNQFFLLDDAFIKGGMRVVETMQDMQDLPEDTLKPGCFVAVQERPYSLFRYEGEQVWQDILDRYNSSTDTAFTGTVVGADGSLKPGLINCFNHVLNVSLAADVTIEDIFNAGTGTLYTLVIERNGYDYSFGPRFVLSDAQASSPHQIGTAVVIYDHIDDCYRGILFRDTGPNLDGPALEPNFVGFVSDTATALYQESELLIGTVRTGTSGHCGMALTSEDGTAFNHQDFDLREGNNVQFWHANEIDPTQYSLTLLSDPYRWSSQLGLNTLSKYGAVVTAGENENFSTEFHAVMPVDAYLLQPVADVRPSRNYTGKKYVEIQMDMLDIDMGEYGNNTYFYFGDQNYVFYSWTNDKSAGVLDFLSSNITVGLKVPMLGFAVDFDEYTFKVAVIENDIVKWIGQSEPGADYELFDDILDASDLPFESSDSFQVRISMQQQTTPDGPRPVFAVIRSHATGMRAIRHLPAGYSPLGGPLNYPRTFSLIADYPLNATLGTTTEVEITLQGPAADDACDCFTSGNGVDVEDDVAVDVFEGTLNFDWSDGCLILRANAVYEEPAYAGSPYYTLNIVHQNLPMTGEHCGEIRLSADPGIQDHWPSIYSFLQINSTPDCANDADPLKMISIGGAIHLDIVLRFKVVEGVLTFLDQGDGEIEYPS